MIYHYSVRVDFVEYPFINKSKSYVNFYDGVIEFNKILNNTYYKELSKKILEKVKSENDLTHSTNYTVISLGLL